MLEAAGTRGGRGAAFCAENLAKGSVVGALLKLSTLVLKAEPGVVLLEESAISGPKFLAGTDAGQG